MTVSRWQTLFDAQPDSDPTIPIPVTIPMLNDIPKPALVLGFGGLIPFVAGAIGVWALPGEWAAYTARAQLHYAATILSFLGAAQWGFALSGYGGRTADWPWLTWSVTPALLAWIATLLAWAPALVLLILSFSAAFFVDLRSVKLGYAPVWYPKLRKPLTIIAILSLGSTLVRLATLS